MPRGRLRIYLGAAPGVGKTYAMLLEGHRRVSQGDDCVVGFVEPHGRRATAALVEGLEVVPRRIVRYRGGTLEEIDVDAVLARHPRVALVDELAHTNAPGLHHSKRWQDVDELLDAGIDVVTTLNIQHLESLNDATAEMTGVRQRETLPDRVARRADEIELIDLSPEAIRRRMVAGVIYPPNRIDAALSHYFRPGNLTALRELALLWLADRVDEGLRRYREEHGIAAPWEARERIVVGVSGGPESDRVIRRAARLVARTPGSDLLAVYVARTDGRLGADAASLARCRALVESLGGSWHQVVGVDIAQALGQFARHENATQLVVGASRGFGFRGMLIGREIVARRVSRLGGMLDIHVLTDERPTRRPLLVFPQVGGLTLRRQLLALAFVVAGLPLVTFVLTQLRGQLVLATDLLVYLLVVVVAGAIGGMYPSVVAAVASGVLADYFFTPPLHSFDVTRATDVVALVGFVAAGLVVSWLAELSARRRTLATRATAEAAAVTAMADSALKGQSDLPRLLELVREIFGLDAVSLLQFLSEPGVGNWQWFVVASAGDRPPETPERATVEAPPEPSPFVVAGRGPRLSPPDQQIFSACAA
ncbi:MAG TPA: DUF4118 domain-containing protein, partial [Acidimicrobiales bacterium]|nr:DUF4118 domain-containing protein [Acidimicrobiales bacterium]